MASYRKRGSNRWQAQVRRKGYPEQYEAAYSLALLLVGTSRSDEAVKFLGMASDGMPYRPRVHYNYELLLAQSGNDAEAEIALKKALDIQPESIDYLYAFVDFYFKRDRLEEALALAKRMITTHPENWIGYQVKAAIEGR